MRCICAAVRRMYNSVLWSPSFANAIDLRTAIAYKAADLLFSGLGLHALR